MTSFLDPCGTSLGDLRSSLKLAGCSSLVDDWKTGTTAQGDIVRRYGSGVVHLIDAARKSRDHRLFTFLIKAITKQLATADKLHPALRRTGVILMCPLCSGPEGHTHPFICPSSRTAYLTARATTTHSLRELCRWIADTGAVSLAHCTQLAVYSTANFFDMQSAGCLLFSTHDGVVPPDLQTALPRNRN